MKTLTRRGDRVAENYTNLCWNELVENYSLFSTERRKKIEPLRHVLAILVKQICLYHVCIHALYRVSFFAQTILFVGKDVENKHTLYGPKYGGKAYPIVGQKWQIHIPILNEPMHVAETGSPPPTGVGWSI